MSANNYNVNSNSNIMADYTDANGNNASAFYRVKAISYREATYYSPIIKILNNTNISSIKIFPNPAQQYIFITPNHKEIIFYDILNAGGVKLSSGNIFNQTKKIDIQTLPTGIYFIRLLSGNGAIMHTEKIFKQ